MIINSRPALMAGRTALWDNYQTVLNGSRKFNPEAVRYANSPVMLAGFNPEAGRFATQVPSMLGDASDASIIDPNSVTGLLQQAVLAWNTQQIANANAQRIAIGLPPLDASAYAPTVNVGLDPTMKMLLIGGVALLAFMTLGKGKRRARR